MPHSLNEHTHRSLQCTSIEDLVARLRKVPEYMLNSPTFHCQRWYFGPMERPVSVQYVHLQ